MGSCNSKDTGADVSSKPSPQAPPAVPTKQAEQAPVATQTKSEDNMVSACSLFLFVYVYLVVVVDVVW